MYYMKPYRKLLSLPFHEIHNQWTLVEDSHQSWATHQSRKEVNVGEAEIILG